MNESNDPRLPVAIPGFYSYFHSERGGLVGVYYDLSVRIQVEVVSAVQYIRRLQVHVCVLNTGEISLSHMNPLPPQLSDLPK